MVQGFLSTGHSGQEDPPRKNLGSQERIQCHPPVPRPRLRVGWSAEPDGMEVLDPRVPHAGAGS